MKHYLIWNIQGFFDIIQINNIQMEAYRFGMKYSEAIGRVSINQSKYTLYFIYIYHQNDLVNNMLCRTHLLPYWCGCFMIRQNLYGLTVLHVYYDLQTYR